MNEPLDLEVVVLDNPFEIWSHPVVQDLFVKTIDFKIRGYGEKYPQGVVPIDTNEFVGTHVLICQNKGGRFQPVTGFRSVSLARCERHFLPFPLLSIAKNSNASRHAGVVQSAIDRCKRENVRLEYFGGWTMDPVYRDSATQQTLEELRNLFRVLDYFYHFGEGDPFEVIGAGVTRFKADLFFFASGYQPLRDGAEVLPSIKSRYLGDEEVRFASLRSYSDLVLKMADQYKNFWDRRTIVSKETLAKQDVQYPPRKISREAA